MHVQFNNTSVELISGERLVVTGTIKCKAGDRVLVLGDNGAGKSTFLMLLHSVMSHPTVSDRQILRGHIHRIDWDSVVIGHEEAANTVHVYQEPRQNFICRASTDEIILPLLNESIPAETAIERLSDLIDAADIYHRNFWRRQVDTLSSGEQQRIAVAAALAPDPTLMLWDEALARIDDASAGAVITLLNTKFRSGILMVATHRPSRYVTLLGPTLTSRILVRRDGQRVLLEQATLDDTHRPDELRNPPDINFANRSLWRKHVVVADQTVGLFQNGMRLFHGTDERVLRIRDLDFITYREREHVATMRVGEVTKGVNYLVGRSGSGKTLLLRMLAGQIGLNRILPFGKGVHATASLELNKLGAFGALRKQGLVVFLPAEPFRWLSEDSVQDEVSLYHAGASLGRRLLVLERLGIAIERDPEHLSYGQRKVLALISLPNRCELVCIDEPFADMGLAYISVIEELIDEQIESGSWGSVILSHSSDINLEAGRP